MYSQNTSQKNRRNLKFLSPWHVQCPDDVVKENQDREIGSSADNSSAYIESLNVETTPLDPGLPKCLDWFAGEYLQENTGRIKHEIEPDQCVACPKHRVSFFQRYEYPQVLKENSKLDQKDVDIIHY